MTVAQKFAEVAKFFIALGSALFFLGLTLLFGFILVAFLIAVL